MASHSSTDVEVDPTVSARLAGLRYASDTGKGYRRRAKPGGGFTYLDPEGDRLRNAEEIQRINHLAIPPAWTDVWINPDARGHLQATGRDARGRKQYRYHPRWRQVRDETKFNRMAAFAVGLPKIRRAVTRDLGRPGLARERVIAVVVRLLDTTYIRVGNEEYAQENKSFGLTTLRDRHVDIEGSAIRFEFRGKSGKLHEVEVRDKRVAGVVRKLQDLPGHQLFQYLGDDGERRSVSSDDVNEYIRDVSGDEFTAKDFRTWAGTVLAAWALQELGEYASQAEAKRHVVRAVESVAKTLGNTPSVSRKCYVHPEIFAGHLDGSLLKNLERRAEEALDQELDGLTPQEGAVLAFLRRRLHETAAA